MQGNFHHKKSFHFLLVSIIFFLSGEFFLLLCTDLGRAARAIATLPAVDEEKQASPVHATGVTTRQMNGDLASAVLDTSRMCK
jgi:hypothetical protein